MKDTIKEAMPLKALNGKRYKVEVWGGEVVRHRRLLVVEVPEEMTVEEIETLGMSIFDDVPESHEWMFEESDGIYGCDDYIPEVQGEAHDDDPTDCRLVRNAAGKLVLEVVEED